MLKKNKLILSLGMIVVLIGCGGSNTVEVEKPVRTLRAEAEELKSYQVNRLARKYQRVIDDKQAEYEEMRATLLKLQPNDFFGSLGDTMREEITEHRRQIHELKQRQEVYIERLGALGKDTSEYYESYEE